MRRISTYLLFQWISQQGKQHEGNVGGDAIVHELLDDLATFIADNTPVVTNPGPNEVTIADMYAFGRPANMAELREAFKVPALAKAWALDFPEQGPATVWWEG